MARSWKELSGDRRVRLGALIAAVVAVAFIAWLVLSGDDSEKQSATEKAAGAIVSEDKLVTAARSMEGPVYWAGRRANSSLELTVTPAGAVAPGGGVFVRYLPPGVKAGDPRPNFLTVATYPLSNAFRAVRKAATAKGMRSRRLPGGGLVVTQGRAAKSAYFAGERSLVRNQARPT